MAKTLSGPFWVSQFPNSTSVDDLTEPFKANVKKFLAALKAAGASVSISATKRLKERAYLMHWSFKLSAGLDPEKVPALAGVDIEWTHRDQKGNKDLAASKLAASEMVDKYDIAFEPALVSRHSEGKAIDMNVSWTSQELVITDGAGAEITINGVPKSGMNPLLHKVGASYKVIKLVTDRPHWSSDGH